MNLKTRLRKLESSVRDEVNRIAHVARFIVDPRVDEVIGYRCNNRQILRLPGESTEALRKRCCDTITSADDLYLTFFPINGQNDDTKQASNQARK